MKISIINKLYIVLVIAIILFLIGCGDNKNHDSHKGHDHSGHANHDQCNENKNYEAIFKRKHNPLVVGPNGGKVLRHPGHIVELWVDDQGYIHLSSLDENGKKISLTDFSVSAIYGERSSPSKMNFKKIDDEWISNNAIAKGKDVPFIMTTEVNEQIFVDRINLKTFHCSGCDLMEYACTCGH